VSSHSASAARVVVGATIIDHAELDAQVLASAAPRRAPDGNEQAVLAMAAHLARHMARNDVAPTDAPHKRSMSAAEAGLLLDRGARLERAGKGATARIYYRTVARQATGEPSQTALDRLRRLETALAQSL
jgi:hypothetical protein